MINNPISLNEWNSSDLIAEHEKTTAAREWRLSYLTAAHEKAMEAKYWRFIPHLGDSYFLSDTGAMITNTSSFCRSRQIISSINIPARRNNILFWHVYTPDHLKQQPNNRYVFTRKKVSTRWKVYNIINSLSSLSETWRTFPVNTNYEVSNLGTIRNKNGLGILKPFVVRAPHHIENDMPGYYMVSIPIPENPNKNFSVHQVVALTWLDLSVPLNNPSAIIVDHIDRNPMNNSLSNLRWVTHSENMNNTSSSKIKKGRFKYDSPGSDLIRRLMLLARDSGMFTEEELTTILGRITVEDLDNEIYDDSEWLSQVLDGNTQRIGGNRSKIATWLTPKKLKEINATRISLALVDWDDISQTQIPHIDYRKHFEGNLRRMTYSVTENPDFLNS